MPEILEVEYYRRAAERLVGRRIVAVDVDDAWVRGADPAAVSDVAVGATVDAIGRHGKVMTVELAARPTLAVRFGMTGRLVVDGDAPIAELEYASRRDDPAWDRFTVAFDDGGGARVNDPRRLGWLEIDPDLSGLGRDAWTIDASSLADALDSRVALKTRLMDQRRIAGLGNLLSDEILWRADLSPLRPARSLGSAEIDRLAATIRATLTELDRAGGSHRGRLQPFRDLSGPCPLDGAALRRQAVGGRTAVWCPSHQV